MLIKYETIKTVAFMVGGSLMAVAFVGFSFSLISGLEGGLHDMVFLLGQRH